MTVLESGNILLIDMKDVIHYGHWQDSLEWWGQLHLEEIYDENGKRRDFLPMNAINTIYDCKWYPVLNEGNLRFFIKEPTEEDLNYPWKTIIEV